MFSTMFWVATLSFLTLSCAQLIELSLDEESVDSPSNLIEVSLNEDATTAPIVSGDDATDVPDSITINTVPFAKTLSGRSMCLVVIGLLVSIAVCTRISFLRASHKQRKKIQAEKKKDLEIESARNSKTTNIQKERNTALNSDSGEKKEAPTGVTKVQNARATEPATTIAPTTATTTAPTTATTPTATKPPPSSSRTFPPESKQQQLTQRNVKRPLSLPQTASERQALVSVLKDNGLQIRRESKSIADAWDLPEQQIRGELFTTMLKHTSDRLLQQNNQAFQQQHHEDTVLQRRESIALREKSLQQQVESESNIIQANQYNTDQLTSQSALEHEDNKKERQREKDRRDVLYYESLRSEQMAYDRQAFWSTLYVSFILILVVSVVVLWDQLNIHWVTSCRVDGSDGGNGGSGGSGDSDRPSTWAHSLNAMNPFNPLIQSVTGYMNNYSCTVIQYFKIFVIVGGCSLVFFVLSYTTSIRIAMVATCAMLMGVLRAHLHQMLYRALYDLPLVVVVHVLLFWPLRWRCCRFGQSIEWEKCGIEWRSVVVYLCLPGVAWLVAFFIGLHMTCDGGEEGAVQCAWNVFG